MRPNTDTYPILSLIPRIGKAQTQSSHPLTPSPPTPPRAKHIHISHSPSTPLFPHISIAVTLVPSHLAYTHVTQTTVHASHSQQPAHPHWVPRQPPRQTKDDHITTDTTQGHRPSNKSERTLIVLQVNINGIFKILEELKLLIHDTHADVITIHETKLSPKANTPNVHNFTTVRTYSLHKAGVGSLHSLDTTLHYLQQTYFRPLILTIQNGQGTHKQH